MLDVAAVIPVKQLSAAKQRLATGLGGQQRRDLMSASLRDTLESLDQARTVSRRLVVSGDKGVIALARRHSCECLPEPRGGGHSEAALSAIRHLAGSAQPPDAVLLLPADCPLIDPREIDGLITGHPARFVTIIPDRHGTGTNGLLLAPPDAIEPSFGEGSCRRHTEAAQDAGIAYAVEPLRGLGMDLDTPADLIAFARERAGASGRRGRHTARVLRL